MRCEDQGNACRRRSSILICTHNFALISVPGDYAAAEAMKALQMGMDVMMFSDNVPVESERAAGSLVPDGLIVKEPEAFWSTYRPTRSMGRMG